jgi:Fe2+ or Zn2+ uptake regulation protein
MNMQRRSTKTKQMIMAALNDSSSALCHEDIEKQLTEKVDRVTIYRVLQSFCDDGKIHKISGDNGKTYYALCSGCSAESHHDNHLHFRCVKCETISCISEAAIAPALPEGYSITGISCLISGFCPNCLTA